MPIVSGFWVPGAEDLVIQGLRTPRLVQQGLSLAASAAYGPSPTGLLVMGMNGPMLVAQGYSLGVGGSVGGPYTEDTIPWETFLEHVLPWVEGCPDPVIIRHCIDASRIFFAKTLAWGARVPVSNVVAGDASILIPLGADFDRHILNGATATGAVVTTSNSGDLPEVPQPAYTTEVGTLDPITQGDYGRSSSSSRSVAFTDPKSYRTQGLNVGDSLDLELSLRPSRNASGFPARMETYIDEIAHGALASLYMLPRQDWTDRGLARDEAAIFAERIQSIGLNVGRGFRRTGRKLAPGARLL